MPKKKNVIITGVAGFVGSNFAKRLLTEGFSVRGIDNLSQGFKRNLKGLNDLGDFQFLKADIRDERKMGSVVRGFNPDYIVHLAAFKIPRYGNAMDTLMVNAKGTEAMLEVARKRARNWCFLLRPMFTVKIPSCPSRKHQILL